MALMTRGKEAPNENKAVRARLTAAAKKIEHPSPEAVASIRRRLLQEVGGRAGDVASRRAAGTVALVTTLLARDRRR
jgi:hypothetical protein